MRVLARGIALASGRPILAPGSALTPFAALLFALEAAAPALREEPFTLSQGVEVTASVSASCARCAWGARGREAALLVLEVDGRYSQHLALVRGVGPADYPVFLGRLEPGPHRLSVSLDRRGSAKAVGEVAVGPIRIQTSPAEGTDAAALAFAPIVYARRGTVKRWSDFPLLTWYEPEPTSRGRRIRYSVIFTNEDGGTPVDRLMATWGRTTDVEFAYAVELDARGRVLDETYQSKDHKLARSPAGARAGTRCSSWSPTTTCSAITAAAACALRRRRRPFSLAERSREAVMDAHPWTYRVSAEEARREGRVAEDARPGSGRIPDPRRFAYLEACTPAEDATLSFALGVAASRRRARLARLGRGRAALSGVAGAPQLPERLLSGGGRAARRGRLLGDPRLARAGLHAPGGEGRVAAPRRHGARASRAREPALQARARRRARARTCSSGRATCRSPARGRPTSWRSARRRASEPQAECL